MYGHDINIIENALQTNLEWIGSTGGASEVILYRKGED